VIGRYEVFFGDYHKLANVEQEYNKVTAADIQRAARQYFDVNNRTVATLVPDSAPETADKSSAGSSEKKQ
jgi:predicted Zn-dependent peptidase